MTVSCFRTAQEGTATMDSLSYKLSITMSDSAAGPPSILYDDALELRGITVDATYTGGAEILSGATSSRSARRLMTQGSGAHNTTRFSSTGAHALLRAAAVTSRLPLPFAGVAGAAPSLTSARLAMFAWEGSPLMAISRVDVGIQVDLQLAPGMRLVASLENVTYPWEQGASAVGTASMTNVTLPVQSLYSPVKLPALTGTVVMDVSTDASARNGERTKLASVHLQGAMEGAEGSFEFQPGREATAASGTIEVWVNSVGTVEWSGRLIARALVSGVREVVVMNLQGSTPISGDDEDALDVTGSMNWNLTVITADGGATVIGHHAKDDAFLVDMIGGDARQLLNPLTAAGSQLPAVGCKHLVGILRIATAGKHLSAEPIAVPMWGEQGVECWADSKSPALKAGVGGDPLKLAAVAPRLVMNDLVITDVSIRADVLPVDTDPVTWNVAAMVEGRLTLGHPATAASMNFPPYPGWARATVPAWITGDDLDGVTTGAVSVDARIMLVMGGGDSRHGLWLDVGAKLSAPCTAPTTANGVLKVKPNGLGISIDIDVMATLPCLYTAAEHQAAGGNNLAAAPVVINIEPRGVKGMGGVELPAQAFSFGAFDSPIDLQATWADGADGIAWRWAGSFGIEEGPTSVLPFNVKFQLTIADRDGEAPTASLAIKMIYASDEIGFTLAGTVPIGSVAGGECQTSGGVQLRGELMLKLLGAKAGDISKTRFDVNATGHCEDADGVTLYSLSAAIRDWNIVDGLLVIEEGTAYVTVARRAEDTSIGNVTGHIAGTVSRSGRNSESSEIPPIFDVGVAAYLKFTSDAATGFDIKSFEFAGEVSIVFGDANDKSGTYVNAQGMAHMDYPCEEGDKFRAAIKLTARTGSMAVDSLSASLVYFCGPSGGGGGSISRPSGDETSIVAANELAKHYPVLDIVALAEGPVSFIEGISLSDFVLNLTALRRVKRLDATEDAQRLNSTSGVSGLAHAALLGGKEQKHSKWAFVGSVRGVLTLGGGGSGATIMYLLDTRTGAWEMATQLVFVSKVLNATLSIAAIDALSDCGIEDVEDDASINATLLRRTTMRLAIEDQPLPLQSVTMDGEISLRLGNGFLMGDAAGEYHCADKHEYHIAVSVENASIPLGSHVTVMLEDIVMLVDGYKKDKTDVERGETMEMDFLELSTSSSLGQGSGNASSNAASANVQQRSTDPRRLDWKVHVEGAGTVELSGKSQDEDDFLSTVVGAVNVSLDAHTDEDGGYILDKIKVRGDILIQMPMLRLYGGMDLHLPCGAFPGPMISGTVTADINVAVLVVDKFDIDVDYYCAKTAKDIVEVHARARLDSLTLQGAAGLTLSDVEINLVAIQKLTHVSPPLPLLDAKSPRSLDALGPPPLLLSADASPVSEVTSSRLSPPPASLGMPSAPLPPPHPPVVSSTAPCCNGNSDEAYSTGECCNTGTLHVQSGAQCVSTRWCKAGGMDCTNAVRISINKKCASATARHLLNASDLSDNGMHASLEWTMKGFVKGRINLGSATDTMGEHVIETVFMFDTEKNTWKAAVGYSLTMDGVKISLLGEVASPCVANQPTPLSGSLELELSQVHMIAEVSALHWCETNATMRLEFNASVPVLDILSSTLRLTDVSVAWRALSGGNPAGTPLAQLQQSGEIRGLVSTDFGVNTHGTVLALAAEVSLTLLYSPVKGSVAVLDPVLDLQLSIVVDGMMPAGEPPMLDAVVGGRYAPMRAEPAEVSGIGTIRLPGLGKNDVAVELPVRLCARLWGSQITFGIRRGRVLELSALLTSESGASSLYGFAINKLSAVATFMSSPNVLAGMMTEDEQLEMETEGEEVDEQSEDNTIAPDSHLNPDTIHAHIKAAYAALGVAAAAEQDKVTDLDATATSPASFPSLNFDFADTMGTIDIFADVELSADESKAALSNFPDGLDASARVVWRGQLLRTSGVRSRWTLAMSEIAVAVGISFKSQSFELELNGEVSTTCTPGGPMWTVNGTMAVPALNLQLLTSAEYRCDTRRLSASISLANMRVPLGAGFGLDAMDVVVSLEALIVRFPGENITTSDDGISALVDDDTATASTGFTGQADILWNITARGVIFLEKGVAGMPELDCEATVEIYITSNHVEADETDSETSDKAFHDSNSTSGDAEIDVEEQDLDIVSINVIVAIAYALDGVALAGSAEFAWPCLGTIDGNASVVFDPDRTGVSASAITASVAVSCAGKHTNPGTPFVEFTGAVDELRITDDIIIELLNLRVVGVYTADGATAWFITLSAMTASPTMQSDLQAAPGATEPAGALYWSVDVTLEVRTPSPLDIEKVGKNNAFTGFDLTASASVSYTTPAVNINAEGRVTLGACQPDVPRMQLDGNVSVTLPGGTLMPLYASLSVECMELYSGEEFVDVGEGNLGPIDDLSTAEGNKPMNPLHIRYTTINITAGADTFEIVPNVLRVDYMEVNASIRIPSSDADQVPTEMQGIAMGQATLVGPLPGIEGFDLEGTCVEFNVSFSTDAEGDMKLDKFQIQAEVEIKYWINGNPTDSFPSAALLGTHKHRFGSNLGKQNVIPALGGSNLPNIHARAYVSLQYPCALGQDQRMELSLALNFGDVAIPDVPVRFIYHCEQEGSKLPAFTAKGIRDTPARITDSIELEGFSIELNGFRINEVMQYEGLVDGHLSIRSSGSDLDARVMFQFNTVLGRYGFAFRISFINEYIRAELAGRLSTGGECKRASTNATTSMESDIASLGDNFVDFVNATGNATGNATLRTSLSGEMQVNIPGMSEILVKMRGWMECTVDDAANPMVELQAWISEVRVHVSEDFELIVKRVGLNLRGYRDPADIEFALTSPGDFKKLAFRARIQGIISLKLSKGMPELGAGFSGGSEAAAIKQNSTDEEGDAAKNNGVVAKATVVVVWDEHSASFEQAVVEVAVHYQAGPVKRPKFIVNGYAKFQYPCHRGTSIVFLADAEVDMSVFRIKAAAEVTLFCGNHRNEPAANVKITIGELTIGDIRLIDVQVIADVFNRPKEGFSLAGSIKGQLKADFGGTLSGDAVGEFIFDTYRNTFLAAVSINLRAGPLQVSLLAAVGSSNNCDLDNGDFLTGNATVTFDDLSMAATVSGNRHCGTGYAEHMRNKSASPVPVAPNYAEALLAVLAPAGDTDRFPMCIELDGLCGAWFGRRVCPAGQYCSLEGQCESAVEMMGRELARSLPPAPPPPASPPTPDAPSPPPFFPPIDAAPEAQPSPANPSPPPKSPPLGMCSNLNMVAGCACGKINGNNGEPDNPYPSTMLCCDKATKRTRVGDQVTSYVWCKQYSPPPGPPPPRPPPPHSPPANWCNNHANGGNGCPTGTKCGSIPSWDPTSKNWNVIYWPKKSEGKCCNKATNTVKMGEVTPSNTGGKEWCKTSSGRKLFDSDSAVSHLSRANAAPLPASDSSPFSPEVCCHGTSRFDMIRSNDGVCCDVRTLTVRHGDACTSSRWCKGAALDSCKEAVKIPPSRKCSEAALGHPSHMANSHMKWRKAYLGAAEVEEDGDDASAEVDAHTLLRYSNNFKGGCSHCSADNRCGPYNGGTVCPGNSVCTSEGKCEIASTYDQPELADIANPMFRFSNNYGLQCITPSCARAGLCGPAHGNMVCPSGQTCMPSGHCNDSTSAALLGIGDSTTALLSAFSDNHLGACPPRMCALDQRCGPENSQVCMSGQMCVRGRCMMKYVFEAKRFLPSDIFSDYSDNNRGVCVRCAGGHKQVCSGKKRLVCPGEMVCAFVHRTRAEIGDGNFTGNSTGTGYEDDDCDDGVCRGDKEDRSTESDGRQRTTFTSGTEGATFDEFAKMAGPRVLSATFGKPICLFPEEVEDMGIQEEDIIEFDDADKAECVRPELISLPVMRNRTVDTKTWAELPEAEVGDGSKEGNISHSVRKYLVMCAVAKAGRSIEGAPCGRHGEFIQRVCPTWAACLSSTAALTAVSAAGGDPEDFSSGYNPRPMHVCVAKTVLKAAGNDIADKDTYVYPSSHKDLALASQVCSTKALVSRAYIIMEAELEHISPGPEPVVQSNSTIAAHFIHLQEPCGPHHGGLVCSDANMVCSAREGICISEALAAAAQYTVLEEYSRNYADFADEETARTIRDQRLEALATVPNAGLNLDHISYRDFPMYSMRLNIPEISVLGGKVKLVGVSLVAYGALVSDPATGVTNETSEAQDPDAIDFGNATNIDDVIGNMTASDQYEDEPEQMTTGIPGHKVPLRSLHWDGEIMGALVMKDTSDGTLPRVEGSFSVAVAWTMPPNGSFTLRPLIARGEVRANFGGSPRAPTIVIRARAAFPVPCNVGFAFRASGSLVMRKLGGSISGALQMSATYFCGQRPDNKIAEFDARLDEPIELAGLLRVTKMTVMGTVFRKPKEEIAKDMEVRIAALGAASRASDKSGLDDDGSDADEEAALSDGESGDGGGYHTEGIITGEVEILGAIEGMSLFASVYFDTGAGAADVFVALHYETRMFVLEAKARIPLGYCDYVGTQMFGIAKINAAPMAMITAEARVVKHCEDAALATERYGHVWLIELAIPHLEVFDGMLVAEDVVVRVIGKQIGTGDSVALSWSLEAEGMLSLGAGAKGQLPGAIKAASISAEFRTAYSFGDRGGDAAAPTDATRAKDVVTAQLATAEKPGLQYFDINATATFAMGHDPISNGPIFELSADLSFSYPCTRPLEASAMASIHNLGGASGLSLPHIDIQLTLACNAGPAEPQLTFKASVKDVTVGGFNLGTVIIAASSYMRPDEAAAALARPGKGSGKNADKEEWYWKGVIAADFSFKTPGMKGDLGLTVFFNTLTNDLKVIATFTLETEAVIIKLEGEHATYCEESGTFFRGTATFKPDKLPFPVPPIVITATKFCKLYLPNTYVFTASLDIAELAGLQETAASSTSYDALEDGQLTAAADVVNVMVTLPPNPAPEAVHHIITSIEADMVAKGLSGAASKVHRSITMTIFIDGIDSQTWESMSSHFVHELSERMACEPEDISILPVKIAQGVELLVMVVQMQRVPFSAHDALLGAARRERMGVTYGVVGAMAAAAQASGMPESPRITIGHDPDVVTTITTVAMVRADSYSLLAKHSHMFSKSLSAILDSHGAKANVTVTPRSALMPIVTHAALGSSDDSSKLGNAKLGAKWLTFKELIISLKGSKLAATDSDTSGNLVWELLISGGIEFKNTASSPVPSFLPLEVKIDLDFKTTWLGKDIKKRVANLADVDGNAAKGCAGRGSDAVGVACGANTGVCPLSLACVAGVCVDPMSEYAGPNARDQALLLVDEAYSYNANHSCTQAEGLPVEESSLVIQAELLWEMSGFRLWGHAHFSVPCTTGEQVIRLQLDLDTRVIQLTGVDVEARLYCTQQVRRHTKMFSLKASTNKLAIWKFSMTDIAIHMEGFSRKTVEKGGVKLSEMYFKGLASGHIHITDAFDTMGTLQWDTLAKTVELGLEFHFAQQFGTAHIEINAVGTIKTDCKEIGDLTLMGEAIVTGLPKIGNAYGKATFLSDCSRSFILEIELSWKEKQIDMGGFKLAVPDWVRFRAEKSPKETSLMIAIPFGRTAIIRMTMFLPFNSIGFQLEFYFGQGTLCDALSDLLSMIPVLKIDPCGFLRNGPLRFIADAIDSIQYDKLVVRLASRAGVKYFAAYAQGINLFNVLKLNIGILVGKSAGKKDFLTFLELTDMKTGGSLPDSFPTLIKFIFKMVMTMMSCFKTIGIAYSSFKFLEPPGPGADLFPSSVFDLEAGFTLLLSINLVSSTDEGSQELLETSENANSNGDGAFDQGVTENTKESALEQFTIMVPFAPDKLCLGSSFRLVNPFTGKIGLPMGEDVTFMTFKPLVCIFFTPPALGVVIEATQYVRVFEGGPKERVAGTARERTIVMRQRFDIVVDAYGVSLRTFVSATLKEGGDYLMNPGGSMPKGGLIFPYNVGLGIKIAWSGVGSTVEMIEFEVWFQNP
jgi:hypothetical protein